MSAHRCKWHTSLKVSENHVQIGEHSSWLVTHIDAKHSWTVWHCTYSKSLLKYSKVYGDTCLPHPFIQQGFNEWLLGPSTILGVRALPTNKTDESMPNRSIFLFELLWACFLFWRTMRVLPGVLGTPSHTQSLAGSWNWFKFHLGLC